MSDINFRYRPLIIHGCTGCTQRFGIERGCYAQVVGRIQQYAGGSSIKLERRQDHQHKLDELWVGSLPLFAEILDQTPSP